jgi:hypothetical protein
MRCSLAHLVVQSFAREKLSANSERQTSGMERVWKHIEKFNGMSKLSRRQRELKK